MNQPFKSVLEYGVPHPDKAQDVFVFDEPYKYSYGTGLAAKFAEGLLSNSYSALLTHAQNKIWLGGTNKLLTPEEALENYGIKTETMEWEDKLRHLSNKRKRIENLRKVFAESSASSGFVMPLLANMAGYVVDPGLLAAGVFHFKVASNLGRVMTSFSQKSRLVTQRAFFAVAESSALGLSVLNEEQAAVLIGDKDKVEKQNIAFAVGLGLLPVGLASLSIKSTKRTSPFSNKVKVEPLGDFSMETYPISRKAKLMFDDIEKTGGYADNLSFGLLHSKRLRGLVESFMDLGKEDFEGALSALDNLTDTLDRLVEIYPDKRATHRSILREIDKMPEEDFHKYFRVDSEAYFNTSKDVELPVQSDVEKELKNLVNDVKITDEMKIDLGLIEKTEKGLKPKVGEVSLEQLKGSIWEVKGKGTGGESSFFQGFDKKETPPLRRERYEYYVPEKKRSRMLETLEVEKEGLLKKIKNPELLLDPMLGVDTVASLNNVEIMLDFLDSYHLTTMRRGDWEGFFEAEALNLSEVLADIDFIKKYGGPPNIELVGDESRFWRRSLKGHFRRIVQEKIDKLDQRFFYTATNGERVLAPLEKSLGLNKTSDFLQVQLGFKNPRVKVKRRKQGQIILEDLETSKVRDLTQKLRYLVELDIRKPSVHDFLKTLYEVMQDYKSAGGKAFNRSLTLVALLDSLYTMSFEGEEDPVLKEKYEKVKKKILKAEKAPFGGEGL